MTDRPPVKPIYGVYDFNAQLIIPMSQNPPVTPIDGSVYIDTDDLRLYAWVQGAWRASRISALPGKGITFTQDALGVQTIAIAPNEILPLTLTSSWVTTAGNPAPERIRTPVGSVQLRGTIEVQGSPIGKSITTLPSGWRPAVPLVSMCVAGNAQQNIQINTDGTVVPINGTGTPTRLGGITFIADGN